MIKNINDFPDNIKVLAWSIYPRKKIIRVNGFMTWSLKELKHLPLNKRLSLPPDIFTAIDKA